MIVLTVDTSTPSVTAGLVRLEPGAEGAAGRPEALAVRTTDDARAHAEVLTPQITACLDEAGATAADLDAVVVGSGPGPFTGLRVGMVTAAAFGDALGIPAYGVCSLDAIAADAIAGGAVDAGREFLVVTDARRREVYWARYRTAAIGYGDDPAAIPERTEGPAVLAPSEVDVGHAIAAAGSAAHIARLGPNAQTGWTAQTGLTTLAPAAPAPRGLVSAAAGALAAGEPPAPLEPLYLRRPDVSAPKRRGTVTADAHARATA